ncbi:Signal recognition particle 14 kDa [Paramuricea clavata]|uniref:Signal recognition particle 14 kDa protein n=1 Tax=Paramuricea clavata TaxID=317549 RepID=A0A7D9H8C0_PARCT|nr:Signal recognition particle 14 kDa [Paramuricea clavata]
MVLLENEAFLTRLTYLYNKTRTSGTVWITMKAYNGRTKPIPRRKKKDKNALLEMEGSESKCLIRATNGKKKISTVINSKDVNRFQQAYTSVLKGCLDNLKKRERKTAKSKKAKATQ